MADKFHIEIDGKEISFNEKELFSFLFNRLQSEYQAKSELKNVSNYTESIFKLLPNEIVTQSNFNQLFTLFFLSGYYYCNFFNKNDVQIIEEKSKE